MSKISCLLSVLCIFIVLEPVVTQNSTNNVTYAPPPAINSTNLFILNHSTVDSRFIGSERIENLDLTAVTVNSTACTNFRINFYNGSRSTKLQNFTILNTPGSWSHLISSKMTLSCSFIFQSANSTYALLRFANQSKFESVFRGDKTKFPTQMSTMTNSDIQSKIVLGENCNIISFDKAPYLFNPSGNSRNTTWIPLNVPNPTLFQGGSPDFSFVVTDLTLYQLNIQNNTYMNITKLPNYQKFEIRNSKNQLIVIGNNASSADNITYRVNQTVLAAAILQSAQGPQFKVISSDNITGEGKTPKIPITISPQLTKVSFFFRPPPVNGSNPDPQIIIKSIDYLQQNYSNFTFQNSSEFMDLMKTAQPKELNMGDNFLLISNVSGLAVNNSLPVFWYYYQYVGKNVALLRKRVIPSNETAPLANLLKADIDPTITNNMVVIESASVTNGVNFTQLDLSSLAANNRIIPTPNPPLLNFTIPSFTIKYPSQRSFDWSYLDSTANSSSATKITSFSLNKTATNGVDANNFTLPGNWTVLAQNRDCKLLSEVGTLNITIYKFNMQTKQFTYFTDVKSLLSSVTRNSSTKYMISLTCDRFSVDNRIYTITPQNNTNNSSNITFNLVQNNLTQFTWSSSDDNLTTVIVSSSIWRFKPESNNSFVKIFDSPKPIFANNKLYQLPGRIVVTGTNATSAQTFAFIDQNGTLKTIFNWTFSQYQSAPMIKLSTNASKIIITGPFTPPNASQPVPKIDIFSIDYRNGTFFNVSAPQNLKLDPANIFINIEDRFLYARQLSASGNITGLLQFVYLFDQDLYLKPAIVTNLTQTTGFTWKKTLVVNTPDNQFLVLEQSEQSLNSNLYVILNSRQLSTNQSNLNSNNGGTQIAGVIVNDKVKLCPVGCKDCSSGTCTTCFTGYVLDSTAYTCKVCAPGCKQCSSSNTSICYSCFERAYLSGTSCLPCNSSCTSCSGSATNCTSSPPGQSFVNNTIINCPLFCHNCSSSTVCVTCIRGFTLTPNNTCRRCASTCSSCDASNITQCTSCAKGLQLVNGVCISCANHCQECNQGICATCLPGFQTNSAGLCILQCAPTCASCEDNQPSSCLSCYSGAIYNNSSKSCSLDLSCNNYTNCTDCGLGFNYILVGTTCMQCPNITNCIQCNVDASQECAMCMQGYFVNDSICSSCNSTCLSCVSSQVCTSCVAGYTLPQDQTSGSCLKCTSPCLTCIGSSTSCSSCITNFTKKGWTCLNNTYVGFTIVFKAAPSTVFNNIDSIVSAFIEMAQKKNKNLDLSSVTFDTFKEGSTIAGGSVTGVDSSALSIPTGQTFGGIAVSSASFVQYGSTEQQQIADSGKNIGLYIGLGVGIPVAIAAIVIISVIIYKRRKSQFVSPQDNVGLNQLEQIKMNSSSIVSAKDKVFMKVTQEPIPSIQLWEK